MVDRYTGVTGGAALPVVLVAADLSVAAGGFCGYGY